MDGNFISLFSELNDAQIEQVMQGKSEFERITVPREEVARIVENLSRLS